MKIPHLNTNHARVIAGGGIFGLTVMVLAMIYMKPELADNDLFSSLSQAIIIQGLIGLAMAYLYTGKNSENPTTDVRVINPPSDPVPTKQGDE